MTDSLKLGDMQGDAPILSVRTVIQETSDETRLEMAYLFDYLDQDCRRKTRWLYLPLLFRRLQSRTLNDICPNGCDGVYDPGASFHRPWQPFASGFFKFKNNSVEKAEQLLKSLRSSVDAWLLYTQSGVINIIIGQRLLLYTLMAQSSLCLAPLTDCFKCIVERLAYERLDWCKSLVLLTSNKTMVELPRVRPVHKELNGDTSIEPGTPMELE